MSSRYLYNTAGNYVAFVHNGHIFTPDGVWLGFITNGNEFYGTNGHFKGYVSADDRVLINLREQKKPVKAVPMRPPSPMRPLRPLRRLRQTKVPYPYKDIFEDTANSPLDVKRTDASKTFEQLLDSRIYAGDGTFLGSVSRSPYNTDSLTNKYGPYGNQYSATSLFNPYSPYGNPYSHLSPFNEFTGTPPRFIKNNSTLGYLTVNKYVVGRVDPGLFFEWIKTLS